MATMSTMVMLRAQCLSISCKPNPNTKPASKPTTVTPMKPKALTVLTSKPRANSTVSPALIAGAFFSALSSSGAALAAQQIADVAEGDNRGLALLIPVVPAILWVLYNILQPALNQLNRMRSENGLAAALGLGGGLAAAGLVTVDPASADELAAVAEASSSDGRGLLLLFVVAPAIAWVLYNILQPALNQINRMRSG